MTVINIPVTGVASVGSTLVVEFFTPNGFTDSHSLFFESNADGQTDTTFLAAADCGVTEPTDTALLGFPDVHLVMNVNGSVDDAVSCDLPEDIPWLSLLPTSGTITPGLSDSLDVFYDSTGLATGEYTGTLCVNSNDLVTPQVQVPVTMRVYTQPTTVSDVSISHSGNDITLNWTAVPGATAYRIYRAANNPYYAPGIPFIYDLAPTNTYTDLGAAGDTANNYSYVVQVVNACGVGSVESKASNRTAEFDYPIQPGTP